MKNRETDIFKLSQELRDIEGKIIFAEGDFEQILLKEWDIIFRKMDTEIQRMKALEKERGE